MTPNVKWVSLEDTIEDAARTMQENDIGALPVCDGHQLVGIVTDRDIIVRAVANGWSPAATRIRAVMTNDVVTCYEDEQVEAAAQKMADHKVRRLVVLGRDKKAVGLVSLGNVAESSISQGRKETVLQGVAQPHDKAS